MAGASVFHVYSNPVNYLHGREVLLVIENPDGSELRGKMEFVPLEPGDYLAPDDYTVQAKARTVGGVNGQDFLQAILNHAWDIGMRPVGFLDTTKEVGALREHLHDMRALVFTGKIDPAK